MLNSSNVEACGQASYVHKFSKTQNKTTVVYGGAGWGPEPVTRDSLPGEPEGRGRRVCCGDTAAETAAETAGNRAAGSDPPDACSSVATPERRASRRRWENHSRDLPLDLFYL
ncbi:hypothetical protein EYF80_056133 [Liparis tanakae]|uniref:Uncharacterized protein n=1 Tax=Liparis tanakae TaxID=230148 RepID=A0A4Z2EZA1_9TELE|nr:hypothetical protein EYF80_056133 [Liparis tanakae]